MAALPASAEQLARVVAGLAVDVDGTGVVGGLGVVEPEVVGEPAAALGDEGEVAGTGVVEVQDVVDAVEGAAGGLDFGGPLRRRARGEVDVGGLVVGDGEGGAGPGVKGVQAVFFADGEVAAFAQVAVDEDRGAGFLRRLDPVFADDHHPRAGGGEVVDHLAHDPLSSSMTWWRMSGCWGPSFCRP